MKYVNTLKDAMSSLSKYKKAGGKDGYINIDFEKFYNELQSVKKLSANAPNLDGYFYQFEASFAHKDNGEFNRILNNNEMTYESNAAANEIIHTIIELLTGVKGLNTSNNNHASTPPNIYLKIIVSIDFSDLDKMIADLDNRINKKVDILQAEFDLFKKSLDALEKRVNTNLEELSKKYSATNSNFDNFVKIVSSTMNALLEMAKGFLRF
ncbi:IpaD/SipD/SspD family type III secretion system needle tip protein [Proteus hauseri]|uniref:IpaD/SipD/SspD family type III secretion system needle tip protein n=1 Tax=Proteus hauseri TaxID=183417 RepID=UPI0010095B0B|nr:IpaD/SipD/SspD family type III secretion system needle tip protein [Proteus hauseri]QAV22721.1 hypothetical protein PH4a_04925 [Proteus hauseri]